MNTLTIDQNNLVQAYKAADSEGKKLLQNLFPSQLFDWREIDSFAKVCQIAGVDPEVYALPEDATDDQIGANAFAKLQLIYRVFNQGWKANWANSSEAKFYPWFTWQAGSGFSFHVFGYVRSYAYVGARLCTDTRDKAIHIGKTFTDIYNQFLTIQ